MHFIEAQYQKSVASVSTISYFFRIHADIYTHESLNIPARTCNPVSSVSKSSTSDLSTASWPSHQFIQPQYRTYTIIRIFGFSLDIQLNIEGFCRQ